MRRISVRLLTLATIGLVLSGCQSAFPRACLQSKDCEHHPVNGPAALRPVNGPSALDGVNGPSVLGGGRLP